MDQVQQWWNDIIQNYSKVKLGLWISVLWDKVELSLRANKKKSDRYCEAPVLHMEMVSWVGYVQVFMRAEYIFPISLAFSRNLIFFPSAQRGEFQMGVFLLIGRKKKKTASVLYFWCLEELTFQSKNAWNEKEVFFLRKILKAIKIFPSKLVISLQIVLGEIDFFFNETGIPLKKKSH